MTSLACEIANLLHPLTFNHLPQRKPVGDGRMKHPSRSREGGEEGGRERRVQGWERERRGEERRGEERKRERDEKQVLEISKTRRVIGSDAVA